MPASKLRSFLAWNRWGIGLILFASLIIPSAAPLQAANGINHVINYQGRLLDSSSANVANGSYSLKFSIYNASSGGTPLYTAVGTVSSPSTVSVSVSSGLFSILIGDTSAGMNALNIDFNQDALYLGITVSGDSEMTPRKRLSAVPYAFNSETLQGNYASSTVTSTGGALFTLHETTADAASSQRTALKIQTDGTSNLNDYLLVGNDGSSDVFTVSRQGNTTTTGNLYVGGNASFANLTLSNFNPTNITWTNATGTNTTSTNLFATNASATNFFVTSIGSNLTPRTNNLFDIGTATKAWKNINASGTVSIGNAAEALGGSSFQSLSTVFSVTGTASGSTYYQSAFHEIIADPSSISGSPAFTGTYSQIATLATNGVSSWGSGTSLVAAENDVYYNSTGTVSKVYGTQSVVNNGDGGTISNLFAMRASPILGGTGGVTNMAGVAIVPFRDGTGTLTNSYGVLISDLNNTSTNDYGIYINAISRGQTDNYSIYSAGGNNYFASSTGIGTTAPRAALDVLGLVSSTNMITGNIFARDNNLYDIGSATSSFRNIYASGTLNIANLTWTNATGTNTTSTNLFATNASATNFFVTNIGSNLTPSINNLFDIGTATKAWANLNVSSTGQFGGPNPNVSALSSTLSVVNVPTGAAADINYIGTLSDIEPNPNSFSGIGNPRYVGAYNRLRTRSDNGLSTWVDTIFDGTFSSAAYNSTGTDGVVLNGVEAQASNVGTGLLGFAIGVRSTPGVFSTGPITSMYGVQVSPTRSANAGTVTNYRGIDILDIVSTSTNAYGIYINPINSGQTNNFGIYDAGGINYFASSTGIGTSAPSAALDVIGTASSTAVRTSSILTGSISALANNTYDIGSIGTAFKSIYASSTVYAGGLVSSGNVIPSTNNLMSLGSFGNAWSNIYTSSTAFLGGVSSTGGLYANANNTYDIGGATDAWKNLYASGTAFIGTDVKVNGSSVCLVNGTNCPASTDTNWTYNSASGFIRPATSTNDVVIGATASTTAPFYFDVESPTSSLQIGRNGNANLFVGTSTYGGGLNSLFTTNGDDLFVQGNIGSASSVYSNGAFIAGSGSTSFGDGLINKTNGVLSLAIGGSNKLILNGNSVTTTVDLMPSASNSINLGSVAFSFANIYASGTLFVGSVSSSGPALFGATTSTGYLQVYNAGNSSGTIHVGDYSAGTDPKLISFGDTGCTSIGFDGACVSIGEAGIDDSMMINAAQVHFYHGVGNVPKVGIGVPLSMAPTTALEVLGVVSSTGIITGHILSLNNNLYDIGSTTSSFRNVYASGTAYLANVTSTNVTSTNIASTNVTSTSLAVTGAGVNLSGLANGSTVNDTLCYDPAAGRVTFQAANCIVSSIRFKEHVQSLDQATLTEKVRQLRSVIFDYSNSQTRGLLGTQTDEGFIAEEVAMIDPYLAIWEPGTSENIATITAAYPNLSLPVSGGTTFIPRSVDYARVSVLLTGAVQSLTSVFDKNGSAMDILSLGTANSSTASLDSYGLTFQGSAWDGNLGSVVTSSFTLVNDTISANASRFSVQNASGTPLLTISNVGNISVSGDLTVGKRLFLGSKTGGVGSVSAYLYADDTLAPTSTYIATNVDGWSTSSTYDYAERYRSDDNLVPGDLVMVDPKGVNLVKRSGSADDTILGIVSTRPGFITGSYASATFPIALAGRVPTRVSAANGPIQAGDELAPSNVPGVAVKAVGAGPVVGIALESYADAAQGLISVFVQPRWKGGEIVSSGASVGSVVPASTTPVPTVSPRAGLAKITAGSSDVLVTFEPLNAYPLVTITPYGLLNATWGVTQVSQYGFKLVLSAPATVDTVFSWKAEPSQPGARISYSDNTSAAYDPSTGEPLPTAGAPVTTIEPTSTAPAVSTSASSTTAATSTPIDVTTSSTGSATTTGG